ncbi:peptidyl-tRNA hydrolase [Candidatus Woesearchaeota archaeon]|nr:MAG: peptidyl-tRNA hydrolase [Candidatus Woesearchaeota archaeon]
MKQVIIVRQDLKLPKGKLAAQVAHASTMALLKADIEKASKWEAEGMAKIVLKVPDERTMMEFFQRAKEAGLKPALVTDAGKTVVAPGTKTCIGIGPAEADKIDEITGDLKLL